MLNPKIQKRQVGPGEFGLFAMERIAAGERIWTPEFDAERPIRQLRWEEIQQLPPEERGVFLRFCYQIDTNLFSGYTSMADAEADDANFMNHSCDPNCWYDANDTLTARRDILPGEEITYDYATDSTDRDWGFSCCCASASCRGSLHRDDWKALEHKYGDHFISYINTKL
ncbi:MAG TPA: SET domain-containing protein, partial [Spirochaetota bacterium]|nr:SET domain-containing protein [Spirochaetota bacterium]